jgi:two-component system heavy metal sensor histidine kinase CusS
LFDRFYRVDAARSSSGAGLGLAIVKSIAELHGGYASVTSAAAEGTRFAIYLPPNPANDSAPPEEIVF